MKARSKISAQIEPTVLSGRIDSYKCTRSSASFFLSRRDQRGMGAIAVAASIAGLSGADTATAANSINVDEEADFVEFILGTNRVEGWVWRSPFKDGDDVEVVGQWSKDHFELFGIARPSDRTIALYPHCSRGRHAHRVNAVLLWIWLGVIGTNLLLGLAVFVVADAESIATPHFLAGCLGMSTFYAAMFTSLSKTWMPFVNLAEKVFRTLGWPDADKVDLVKITKKSRTPVDPGELGTFYFRY